MARGAVWVAIAAAAVAAVAGAGGKDHASVVAPALSVRNGGGVPVEAKAARQGKRTLLLVADREAAGKYGRLTSALTARRHEVTVKSVDEVVALERYGEPVYDNVALLAPTAASFGGLSAAALTAFVDAGGNLLAGGDVGVSAAFRELASEFGVDFDAPRSRVIDHFSYDTVGDRGRHTRVLTNAASAAAAVVGGGARAGPPIVYDGTGMVVAGDNILALRALTASGTGYSAVASEAVKEYPQSVGSETVLVAAVQARNNARATFTGSLYLLSDDAAEARVAAPGAGSAAGPTGNAAFVEAVVAWTFQEAGVLRARNLRHHHQDGSGAEQQVEPGYKPDLPLSMFPEPEIARNSLVYRINDAITFSVDVETYDAATGAWKPYVAADMQLEFVMLDPYIRVNLNASAAGHYVADFTVPDTYGIYHFRVLYRRPGLTVLSLKEQVSVRPFRHDEYERFIVAAYPYYTAAFTIMAGVFVFAALFLFSSKATTPAAAARPAAPASSSAK